MARLLASTLVAGLLCSQAVAQSLKISSQDEILKSAGALAKDLMALYEPDAVGRTPGLLPDETYYWWESGVFMTTFIDYWRLTGDSTYNDIVLEGMLHQKAPENDFMPVNQTKVLDNESQCTWALAAMLAVENNFPGPPKGEPQWLDIAQKVFDYQVMRLDEKTCGGGLRWQVFPFNNGFNYKDGTSNSCFINLGARLLRHTGNETYAEYVNDAWKWMTEAGLLDTKKWQVYSGLVLEDDNCDDVDKTTFSLPLSYLLHGAASMYNHTGGSDEWRVRLDSLVDSALENYFPEGIATEKICEEHHTCNIDQIAFKGQLIRWLAGATQLAPRSAEKVLPVLKASAKAAVSQCTGGKSGRQCGFYWSEGEFYEPESSGVGEQMNALAVVSNLLIEDAKEPAQGSSGGSGKGDSDNASKPSSTPSPSTSQPASSDPGSAAGRYGLESFAVAVMALSLMTSVLLG